MAVVEEVTRNHPAIDRRRVYLTGISMGGFGAWSLAARYPEAFAAVVPVCGRGDPEQARLLVGVPLWAVHGEADTVVAPEGSRCMIEAIRAAGGTPQYTELRGVGHSSWRQAFDDSSGVLAWMFAQARKSPASFEGFRRR
jgi:predicted peptidase